MNRKRLLTVSAVVIGMILAGVMLVRATIPSASGVIYGCYNPNSGTLKVIDNSTTTCNPNETPLNWNQAGSSHAYIATATNIDVDSTGENVATINVPSGSYIIDGKATLALANSDVDGRATCQLVYSAATGTPGDAATITLLSGGGPTKGGTRPLNPSLVSVHDAQTFSVTTAIQLFCQDASHAMYGEKADNVVLRATQVGGIN